MFAPVGNSIKIALRGGLAQVVAIPAGATAVRLMAVKYPNSAFAYVNIGDSAVTVSLSNGMPVNLDGRVAEVIPVGSATHIAVIMASGSEYDIMLTPGEVI